MGTLFYMPYLLPGAQAGACEAEEKAEAEVRYNGTVMSVEKTRWTPPRCVGGNELDGQYCESERESCDEGQLRHPNSRLLVPG